MGLSNNTGEKLLYSGGIENRLLAIVSYLRIVGVNNHMHAIHELFEYGSIISHYLLIGFGTCFELGAFGSASLELGYGLA